MAQLFKKIKSKSKEVLKASLPAFIKRKMGMLPPVGKVDFGDLRRLQPIDPNFGFSRGEVIDRYYIEKFLTAHAQDIHGRVLELGDNSYTTKFGGKRVTRSDVLHYTAGNPQATIVADLTKAENINPNIFDCIIITQSLQMIYDVRSALKHLHRILKPNGVLLATSHGTSKICRILGIDPWGEYWRFTAQSSQIMFEEFFKPGNVKVAPYGNVLTAISFLQGLAAQDLTKEELDYNDPRYEVLIGVRAVKSVNV